MEKVLNKLESAFGSVKMTWKNVIIYSLLCGVIPGLIMLPEFLEDTSLQLPGITVEFWILAAMFIILNCEKPVEAGVKTFVFFLISQPLIYLVQVPFCWLHWGIFSYYPRWFYITLATLPGGMIAWYTKKGNLLSVLILSVANFLISLNLSNAVFTVIEAFPKYLLAVLFMVFEIVFLIRCIFKEKKMRTLASVFAAVIFMAMAGYMGYTGAVQTSSILVEVEGSGPYEITSESEIFSVSFTDNFVKIEYKTKDIQEDGTYTIEYTDSEGNTHEITLFCSDGDCSTYEDE